MLLNITDVLTTEGRTEEKQLDLEWKVFSYQGRDFRITGKEPLVLGLSNNGDGKAKLTGRIKLAMQMQCDRCLEDVPYTFDISFVRQVSAPEEETGGAMQQDKESEEDILLDQKYFMEGYQLNVESLVSNEIMLNWPMKILCREDCKGLCSVCGKNLNDGECGCDTFVPDPRMAKIQEIFHRDKEV